jgi:hypothetical protein
MVTRLLTHLYRAIEVCHEGGVALVAFWSKLVVTVSAAQQGGTDAAIRTGNEG